MRVRACVCVCVLPRGPCWDGPAPIQGSGRASGSLGLLLQQAACSWSQGGRRYTPPGCLQRGPYRQALLVVPASSQSPIQARTLTPSLLGCRCGLGAGLPSPNQIESLQALG